MPKSTNEVHIVLTGPITGTIPISHEAFPDGVVDVSPGQLQVGSVEEAQAVAHAIEVAHVARGTHPVQLADRLLSKADEHSRKALAGAAKVEDFLSAHEQQKRELAERTGLEV